MSYSKYIKFSPKRKHTTLSLPKPVPGFSNYLADSSGRVYFSDKLGRLRQLTQFLSPNSRYLRVYVTKDRIKRNIPVHNLVLSAYRNYNPEYISVKHLDRNRFNNRLSNLKLSGSENFDRRKKTDEYRIECLEENLKEKTGYDFESETWKNYLKIRRKASSRTVINWLTIVLKNL